MFTLSTHTQTYTLTRQVTPKQVAKTRKHFCLARKANNYPTSVYVRKNVREKGEKERQQEAEKGAHTHAHTDGHTHAHAHTRTHTRMHAHIHTHKHAL